MTPTARTPGVAHRAVGAELWLRDADGRGLRPVTLAQAELLVSDGAAYPIVAAGVWKEVRLKVALPPNSRHTWRGRATAPGSPVSTFQHNFPACRTWQH